MKSSVYKDDIYIFVPIKHNYFIMIQSNSTNHINIARYLRTLIERDDGKKKQRLACKNA